MSPNPPTMTDYEFAHLDMMAAQIELFAKIERHLGTLADYADMLRIQATGEKVYEVQGYVVSATSNGDKCVYLYATHPGLQYRVCTVYEERLAELPFTVPATAKIWDGEAAPSREGAAKKGYMLGAPHPFKVSLLPTGGTTDAGLPVHKFNRIIGDVPAHAPDPAPVTKRAAEALRAGPPVAPAPSRQPAASNGPKWTEPDLGPDPFDDLPSATEDPTIKQTLAKAANGNGKRPAWQDPADHKDQQMAAEAAAHAAFEARRGQPEPPPTHQELDAIAAKDESAVAGLLATMRALAKTAKNREAAAAIAKSAEGQAAGIHAEKSLTAAIKALKGMQS